MKRNSQGKEEEEEIKERNKGISLQIQEETKCSSLFVLTGNCSENKPEIQPHNAYWKMGVFFSFSFLFLFLNKM